MIKLKIYDEDGDCIFMMKYDELLREDTIKVNDIIGQVFSMDLSLHYDKSDGMGGSFGMLDSWCRVQEIKKKPYGLEVNAINIGDRVEEITHCTDILKLKPATKKDIMEHISKCWRCREHLKAML